MSFDIFASGETAATGIADTAEAASAVRTTDAPTTDAPAAAAGAAPATDAGGANAPSTDPNSPNFDITQLEPRAIIKCPELIHLFVDHHCDHLPDVSDRPDIPPKNTQFWKKDDIVTGRVRKNKKRFAASHSMLRGMRAKGLNDSIDSTMSHNYWCVTFKDKEGCTVTLVDACGVCSWLHYISGMVSQVQENRANQIRTAVASRSR